MPFIGQQPITGAYSKLDAITTSATATYNLLLGGSAYSPASANHLLVSLNGVMQAPQDSFTVSGSTIIFASALTSSDNIDFIMALGDVLNIGTPSDGTVTAAKIGSGAVTDAKIASSAVTDAKIAGMTATKLTGTVSNARFPAGTIVQVVTSVASDQSVGGFSSTNSTPQDTGHSVTITPQYSDSDILIQLHTIGGQTVAGRSYKLHMYKSVGGATATQATAFNLGDDSDGTHKTQIGQIFLDDTVGNTSARVYSMRCGTDGSGTAKYNYQNGQPGDSHSVLMAMEIKR
jgi:hypothetical protein